jgi:hypothetical protein
MTANNGMDFVNGHAPIGRPTRLPGQSVAWTAHQVKRLVNGHPNSRIDDLLPWAYRAAPELNAVA